MRELVFLNTSNIPSETEAFSLNKESTTPKELPDSYQRLIKANDKLSYQRLIKANDKLKSEISEKFQTQKDLTNPLTTNL
jgi:hypothetical protein